MFRAIVLTALLATSLASTSLQAQEREQIERRLQSVHTLLENSSAARQIKASGDAGARAHLDEATALHGRAQAAYQGGDYAQASRLLDSATRELMAGARMAAPETVTGDKKLNDYNNRLESVRALLAAQERIAREKNQAAQGAETTRQVEAVVAESQAQLKQGDIDRARATLDRAYLLAKAAVGNLRRGDTLVRSLNFASKEEEYRYELDRNETHKMLVKVLLEERRAGNPALDRSVQGFLDQASRLRAEGETQAQGGNYEAAVATLEESTKQLVRAIRGAGVFIPG